MICTHAPCMQSCRAVQRTSYSAWISWLALVVLEAGSCNAELVVDKPVMSWLMLSHELPHILRQHLFTNSPWYIATVYARDHHVTTHLMHHPSLLSLRCPF
jgi:hypothetical protein